MTASPALRRDARPVECHRPGRLGAALLTLLCSAALGGCLESTATTPCHLAKCARYAICTERNQVAVCACLPGFAGDGWLSCTDVDECQTDHGGCDPLATCTNREGSFACGPCPPGFAGTGATGCLDVDECQVAHGGCDPLSVCTNTYGSWECGSCPPGYFGTGTSGCVEIDECLHAHGGCDPLVTCVNTPGSRLCGPCPSGYSGDGEAGCVDIDECGTDHGGCDPLVSCTNTVGGRDCGPCPVGYVGKGEVGCTPVTGPTLVRVGEPGKILLRGTVIAVPPAPAFAGEVLVEGAVITCVGASCAAEPAAAAASVVETGGVIMPGMIDAHNHILYDIFDATDWTPSQVYTNHKQWTAEARYGAMVDAKQYLNGEGSALELGCEMIKYGEVKAVIAGTTSVVGAANPGNKACYRTVARTIDQTANGLCGVSPPVSCPDHVQAATLFPTTSSADGVCGNFADGSTDCFLVHAGEGVDQVARDEWNDLFTITTVDGCLFDPRTAIVHGTAFGDTEFAGMGAFGMGLVWSPASNVFLYGGGTDLTKTTDIPLALSEGVRVALAPDWSLGGSQNLLNELRFAAAVDAAVFGDLLSPADLVAMVTTTPADILGLAGKLGALAVGLEADLVVLSGDGTAAYDAVLAAHPWDVQLTMVHGVVMYGNPTLAPLGPASPGCEALDVCGVSRFLCIAVPAVTSGDPEKFTQSFADVRSILSTELAAYDALDLSIWDFAPLAPIVTCP